MKKTIQILILSTLVALGGSFACTDTGLESMPVAPPEVLDNLIRIEGEYCTEPSADIVFPIKVLYIIDQSASLQCTDSMNRRFEALNSSINELLGAQSNAQVGFIGFSSWARSQDFTRDRDAISNFVDPAAGLGPATDYQGALATALGVIERDILESGGAERARTRYIVNFVSDGVPEPRCNAGCEDDREACNDGIDNDGDGLVDEADPDCANIDDNALSPDNLYGVCNTDLEIPDDVYVDFDGICPAYNQEEQIMRRVSQLTELQDIYSVGDITLNTVLLFSPQSVVEARCPDASASFGYDKEIASGLMQNMANEGGGTFRDINLTTDTNFLSTTVSSITAQQTLTSMIAYNEHARLNGTELQPDSDRDGLSDQKEIELRTDRTRIDTDSDNYRDLFEYRFRSEGFDPLNENAPAITCADDRDSDGDGLNDCEERFLETDPLNPDTDGDGIPDYIELVFGTDPLVHDSMADLDFDGVSNGEEIRAGTNPLVPDPENYRQNRVVYGIDDLGVMDVENPGNGRMEERHCYDFSVSRLPMVQTPIPRQHGINRILLYTAERPSRVAGVPSEYRVGCFEAFWGGGNVKSPPSGVIDISNENLDLLRRTVAQKNVELGECGYFPEDTPVSRSQVEDFMSSCMPPKIELDRKLYSQKDIVDLLRKNFDGDNIPRLPSRGFELFTPIQNFDRERDCFRLWEFELMTEFFSEAERACEACVEERVETEEDE